MSKKIASEFATGVVVITALVIGGFFWLSEKKMESESERVVFSGASVAPSKSKGNEKKSEQAIFGCQTRYFEGEGSVRGWLVKPETINDDKLTVEIQKEDIEKLPSSKADTMQETFVVTLIDPTDQNRVDLKNATKEKPANLTVRGYARPCQPSPILSIEPATIAFRK
jgi:hypothetical protein